MTRANNLRQVYEQTEQSTTFGQLLGIVIKAVEELPLTDRFDPGMDRQEIALAEELDSYPVPHAFVHDRMKAKPFRWTTDSGEIIQGEEIAVVNVFDHPDESQIVYEQRHHILTSDGRVIRRTWSTEGLSAGFEDHGTKLLSDDEVSGLTERLSQGLKSNS